MFFSELRFNPSCPFIFPLFSFFSDDSIIFNKASLQQLEVIKEVLQDYVSISGQEVNFQKYALFLDKSIPLPIKDSIIVILGITKIEDHGTYLGLPCLIR